MGNYIDLEYIEATSGRTFTETTTPSSTQINSYINLAEQDFQRECGSYLEEETTEIVKCGSKGIYLSNLPINTIVSIKQSNGDRISPLFQTGLESTDYRLKNITTGFIELRHSYIGLEYEVTYTSGYDSENIPENIKYLVYLYTMRYIFNNTILNTDGNFGNSQEIIDVGVYKEITGKSLYTDGLVSLDRLISDAKSALSKKFKTIWVN